MLHLVFTILSALLLINEFGKHRLGKKLLKDMCQADWTSAPSESNLYQNLSAGVVHVSVLDLVQLNIITKGKSDSTDNIII